MEILEKARAQLHETKDTSLKKHKSKYIAICSSTLWTHTGSEKTVHVIFKLCMLTFITALCLKRSRQAADLFGKRHRKKVAPGLC